MTLLGEAGLRQLAAINHGRAKAAATELAKVPGVSVMNGGFFNEFTLILPKAARPVIHQLAEKGGLGGGSLGRLSPAIEALPNGSFARGTHTVPEEIMAPLCPGAKGGW